MTPPELSPVQRLVLSRAQLRSAMLQSDTGTAKGSANHTLFNGFMKLVKTALPDASLLLEALTAWWTSGAAHRDTPERANAVEEALQPLAERYPLLLVAGAAAAGGLLVWLRPWRWALRPALLTTWGPALLSGALASGPLQAWLLAALARGPSGTSTPASAEPPCAGTKT